MLKRRHGCSVYLTRLLTCRMPSAVKTEHVATDGTVHGPKPATVNSSKNSPFFLRYTRSPNVKRWSVSTLTKGDVKTKLGTWLDQTTVVKRDLRAPATVKGSSARKHLVAGHPCLACREPAHTKIIWPVRVLLEFGHRFREKEDHDEHAEAEPSPTSQPLC
jgi:hypothetical protein